MPARISFVVALALVATCTGLRAQEPPSALTATSTGTFENAGDIDSRTVSLQQGNDYAIGAKALPPTNQLRVTVKRPGGTTIASFDAHIDEHNGVEIRAPVTGTYTIRLRELSSDSYPGGYDLRFGPDCRKGRTTKCSLKPGVEQQRQTTFSLDHDWHRLRSFTVGRTYQLSFTSGGISGHLAVRRRDGSVVARTTILNSATLAFKAVTSELYAAIEADGDVIGPYKILLTAK